ncbi:hypothetical protein [Clostridium sp. AUH-JLR23]|uniref:hypothetical protein n=1 Tax=Clostridium sp. AUH-JLR23 TaxID=1505062 RepID=UPI0035613CD5
MLQEILEVFGEIVQQDSRIVTDSYSLKDGTYRLIEMNNQDGWKINETIDIFYDKKSKQTNGSQNSNYAYIRELDYYSKLLEMNKPIDPKKVIHSCHYLSLAVKKDSILSGKLNNDIIKKYYAILKNPMSKYEKKANSRKLYEKVEKEIGQVDIELIDSIEDYVLHTDIFEGINLDKKDYVKVFFVFGDQSKTLDYYKRENKRYLLPNLYNSNDYNVEDGKDILGLPNNNMNLNSKKPFLLNKTRKVKTPYLVNQEQALLQAQFFDYLWGQVSKGCYDFYINTFGGKNELLPISNDSQLIGRNIQGYYIHCQKGKNEAEIIDSQVVSSFSNRLNKSFCLENYMEIPEKFIEKSGFQYDEYIDSVIGIFNIIDRVFFANKLSRNLYSDADNIQIIDGHLKRCLLTYRDKLKLFKNTGDILVLKSIVDKMSWDIITNTMSQNSQFMVQHQLNLRWSLLDYFNDERKIGEKIMNVKNQLRVHINLPKGYDWDFDGDEEFNFAVGQLIQYFLFLNKSSKKTHAYVNQYLNCKDVKKLKQKLIQMYKKYSYAIDYYPESRSEKLIEHIMQYDTHSILPEYIVSGFNAQLLIIEKNKEENKDE